MINIRIDHEFCPDSMVRDWIVETSIEKIREVGTPSITFKVPGDLVEEWDCPETVYALLVRHVSGKKTILYIAPDLDRLTDFISGSPHTNNRDLPFREWKWDSKRLNIESVPIDFMYYSDKSKKAELPDNLVFAVQEV